MICLSFCLYLFTLLFVWVRCYCLLLSCDFGCFWVVLTGIIACLLMIVYCLFLFWFRMLVILGV